jgi:aspartyl-tRNA(Asn)/glutamyl-tRNA(Gln) amidotransferase subunit A
VVERLRAAGAVVLGKQNLHEFAGGTTSTITHFGAVHNPWDLERTADITGAAHNGCIGERTKLATRMHVRI